MRLLLTGGAGFIGSAMLRSLCGDGRPVHQIRAVTRTASSQNAKRLATREVEDAVDSGRLELISADLASPDVSGLCEGIDVVVHYAAKTFVDHSIRDDEPFILSNYMATCRLLKDAVKNKVKRFVHISTDEVLGQILEGAYKEDAPHNPRNPYAATKAAAEDMAIAYAHSHGLHTVILRNENVYGPWQHPQKVFPAWVRAYLSKRKLPVYGDGGHVRQWLHVDDQIAATIRMMEADVPPGSVFHVAGNQELTNLELASRIVLALTNGDRDPGSLAQDRAFLDEYIRFIDDSVIRPGHDRRYALDSTKIRQWWAPEVELRAGIAATVSWYLVNSDWLGA